MAEPGRMGHASTEAARPVRGRLVSTAFLGAIAILAGCSPTLDGRSDGNPGRPSAARADGSAAHVASAEGRVAPLAPEHVALLKDRMLASRAAAPVPDTGGALAYADHRTPPTSPPRVALSERPPTQFVAFDSAPFPYDGAMPGGGPFLDVVENGRRAHKTPRGRVLWQDTTYADRRVLVHVPQTFDARRAGAIVVFFHGHGATLQRDVLDRQKVAEQVSASGANVVLLAPQFAVDARDSSAGHFWEPGGFRRFLDEAADKLALAYGNPDAEREFRKMPVVLVAYSGGFLPAAWGLKDVAAAGRVRGVVLLDALYGEHETFANWIGQDRSGFFVSAYTRFTQKHNAELQTTLTGRGIPSGSALGELSPGSVTFLPTGPEAKHDDYVTQAWTRRPIADLLGRMPDLQSSGAAIASADGRPRRRSAEAQ